jgi:hypothetical protein
MLVPLKARWIAGQVDAGDRTLPGAPHAVTATSAFAPDPCRQASLGPFGRRARPTRPGHMDFLACRLEQAVSARGRSLGPECQSSTVPTFLNFFSDLRILEIPLGF